MYACVMLLGLCFLYVGVFLQHAVVVRNRASPVGIVRLCRQLTPGQKKLVIEMGLSSILDIKCDKLNNPLVAWLTRLYNPATRSFVIPGRGNVPLTEESVHQIMGIPWGRGEVKYREDFDLEASFGELLFGEDGSRPKVSRVAEIIVAHKRADETFQRLWLLYVLSTLLVPTTAIRISNKCYPILVSYVLFFLITETVFFVAFCLCSRG